MNKFLITSILVLFLICSRNLEAYAATLDVSPSNSITQGEPFLVNVSDLATSTTVKTFSFDGKDVGVFVTHSKPAAFVGIDLNKKPGVYPLSATLSDGQVLTSQISVIAREKIEAPLGIPEKLGGNTLKSQAALVSSLSTENIVLSTLKTNPKALWSGNFIFPLSNPVVTDAYGYLRQTGPYSIAHKGTDFRASEKTPVVAMNDGVVRLATYLPTYGNTVVVDHGLGLMSFYMHLSKLKVTKGKRVTKSQLIGLSGHTGYADQPHLHLTVRLNGVSIDPMKFMDFFK